MRHLNNSQRHRGGKAYPSLPFVPFHTGFFTSFDCCFIAECYGFFLWHSVLCELTPSYLWGTFKVYGVYGLHKSHHFYRSFFTRDNSKTEAFFAVFNWILLCLMASAICSRKREPSSPETQLQRPWPCAGTLTPSQGGGPNLFFSDKVARVSFEQPPPARLRISADGANEQAIILPASQALCKAWASSAADNLWQSNWLHFLSWRFKWSTICRYLVRNISWKYKIVK